MIPAKEFEGELWIKAADFHWQKKEWVGLTDEEIKVCAKGGRSIGISFHDAICRAEAKLKEKNT